MPNKIDTLFNTLFNIKPKNLEPRPKGQQLFKMISQRISGDEVTNRCNFNRLFAQQDSVSFEVIEEIAYPDGTGYLIEQITGDGSKQFTLYHGEKINPNNLTEIAQTITRTEWFSLDDLRVST